MAGLADQHTPEAIPARLASATEHSYLGEGMLGAIDGTVTGFAIGVDKGRLLPVSALRSGVETRLVGGGAAALAYLIGVLARDLA